MFYILPTNKNTINKLLESYLYILYINHCTIIRNIYLGFILTILFHFLMYYILIVTIYVKYMEQKYSILHGIRTDFSIYVYLFLFVAMSNTHLKKPPLLHLHQFWIYPFYISSIPLITQVSS